MADQERPRRLYVQGLPAGSSLEDLKKRFSSFGKVSNIEGHGKLDAVGLARPYAFVELVCTEAGLKKCKNTLSGTVWKGATLRIQDAKPDFKGRHDLQKEQEGKLTDAERRRAKRKRKIAADGREVRVGELATADNIANRKGWRKSEDKTDPIFPIVVRPDHPLPPRPDGERPKKKQKLTNGDAATSDAPTRARRQKIDPVQWDAKHTRGKELEKAAARSTLKVAPSVEKEAVMENSSVSSSSEEEPVAEALPALPSSGSTSEDEGPPKVNSHIEAPEQDFEDERLANLKMLDAILGAQSGSEQDLGVVDFDETVEVEAKEPSVVTELVKEPTYKPERKKPKLQPAVNGHSTSAFKPVQRYEPDSESSSEESEDEEEAVPALQSAMDDTTVAAKESATESDAKLRSLFAAGAEHGSALFGGMLDGMDLDEDAFPLEEQTTFHAPPAATAPPPRKPAAGPQAALPPLFAEQTGSSAFRRFRLNGSLEDYIARHAEKRPELTAQYKKRHREAKKKRRAHRT